MFPSEGAIALEVVSIGLVVGVALFPLVASVCRGRSQVVIISVVVVWLSACAAVSWTAASYRTPRVGGQPVTDRPLEVPEEGYVSSRSCRACHPHNYASWHASYHRTMTQLADPAAVVGNFTDVHLQADGRGYHLQRHGDEFWVDIDDTSSSRLPDVADLLLQDDQDRDAVTQKSICVRKRIVMTTGSHHYQAYWYPSGKGRELSLLPFVYLIDEQRWVNRAFSFLKPPDAGWPPELGRWNTTCITCHTTHGRARLNGPNPIDSRVSEFGIACEACHGPGQQHVRLNRNPLHRYDQHLGGKAQTSIVNPQRLSAQLSSQVCGQCHSINLFYKKEVADRWSEHGFQYRPGDDLGATRFFARTKQDWEQPIMRDIMRWTLRKNPHFFTDRFWSDGMVRVTGREYNGLLATPCYKHGDRQAGILSCLSCHSMHKETGDPRPLSEWANDQLKAGMDGNQACIQCHQDFLDDQRLDSHTHHLRGSTGSTCYNCHMPHTTYGLLKAIRSHQVSSPSVTASLKTGRPNACNQCHLDKPLGWTAEYLTQWYGTAKPRLSEDEQAIAASLLWLLRGDAGQRALMAWSMGWEPARAASGTEWMGIFLAQLLADPYEAVRFLAYRSLRRLPGYSDFQYRVYDSDGPIEERDAATKRAMDIWYQMYRPGQRPTNESVLFGPDGKLQRAELESLMGQRDNRRLYLAE